MRDLNHDLKRLGERNRDGSCYVRRNPRRSEGVTSRCS